MLLPGDFREFFYDPANLALTADVGLGITFCSCEGGRAGLPQGPRHGEEPPSLYPSPLRSFDSAPRRGSGRAGKLSARSLHRRAQACTVGRDPDPCPGTAKCVAALLLLCNGQGKPPWLANEAISPARGPRPPGSRRSAPAWAYLSGARGLPRVPRQVPDKAGKVDALPLGTATVHVREGGPVSGSIVITDAELDAARRAVSWCRGRLHEVKA